MFKSYRFFPFIILKKQHMQPGLLPYANQFLSVSKVANFRRKGRDDLPADVLLEAQ